MTDRLADILSQRHIDLCIANGENSASGFGITPRLAEELFSCGIEVITGGNHIWDRKEILDFFPHEPRLLRPANFPNGLPGAGLEPYDYAVPGLRVFAPNLIEGTAPVIQRGLSPEPNDRHATPQAFAHAIDEAIINAVRCSGTFRPSQNFASTSPPQTKPVA